ncbi:MFS transporter [Novosphingobium sp. MW5]|nr:MFS transporter [Novosphingobium sp. MW5]
MIAALGLLYGSFTLFVVGALFTGVYMSAQGFFRFAATDTASDAYKPKAISYVMAGGLLSAIIGPQLVKVTAESMLIPFLGTYFGVIVLNLVGMWLFVFLDIPKPPVAVQGAPMEGRSRSELLRDPIIVVAIICATVAYALMNLVMTSTPLAVVGCGYQTSHAADIVSAHVLAMYAPSFFTGHLIARFGVQKIIAAGLLILAGSGAVALSGVELQQFFISLILLGIGWNFAFIGGTTMLAQAHNSAERGRIQGVNDAIVFGGVTVASLSSGQLMNCSGSDVETGWQLVNLAMLPFLVLAGGALIWLALRPRAA